MWHLLGTNSKWVPVWEPFSEGNSWGGANKLLPPPKDPHTSPSANLLLSFLSPWAFFHTPFFFFSHPFLLGRSPCDFLVAFFSLKQTALLAVICRDLGFEVFSNPRKFTLSGCFYRKGGSRFLVLLLFRAVVRIHWKLD